MELIIQLIHGSSFYEFAALLTLAALAGALGMMMRQPLIIAFIAIGVLVGPSAMGFARSGDEIALLAKLGIAVLLFIVGLKLDMKLIRSLGTMAVTIGLAQIAATVALGAGLSLLLGFPPQPAILIGVALAFSSTIIIIKLLSDKREIDSLHGRISLGVLIIQDLAVVCAMIVMAAFSATEAGGAGADLLTALIRVAASTAVLIVALALFMRYAARRVAGFMARNQELLLCFAIAWAVMLAALCDFMGLSKELGGLLAGVSLASTPYREAMISRLTPLRDFLLLFFFISLGLQLDLSYLGSVIAPAFVLSLFVLLFKPLVIVAMCGMLGYRKRTGFMAGLSLAQISEFSLIFAAMAFSAGFITQEVLGLVTLVGLVTIITSTYLISLSHAILAVVEPALGIFERRGGNREAQDDKRARKRSFDFILLGLGRYGREMGQGFLDSGKSVLAVDFNPEEIRKWCAKGNAGMYGDATDPEFYHSLPIAKAKWVICAMPQHHGGLTQEDPRLVLLQIMHDGKFKGKVAIACHTQERVEQFEALGVDTVFFPHRDAARRAVDMVLKPA